MDVMRIPGAALALADAQLTLGAVSGLVDVKHVSGAAFVLADAQFAPGVVSGLMDVKCAPDVVFGFADAQLAPGVVSGLMDVMRIPGAATGLSNASCAPDASHELVLDTVFGVRGTGYASGAEVAARVGRRASGMGWPPTKQISAPSSSS